MPGRPGRVVRACVCVCVRVCACVCAVYGRESSCPSLVMRRRVMNVPSAQVLCGVESITQVRDLRPLAEAWNVYGRSLGVGFSSFISPG